MKKNYMDRVHLWGIFWDIGAIICLLSVPLIVSVSLGEFPILEQLLSILVKVMPLYIVTGVIEVLTFVPMLGAGGAYLSFVTGNISNLKLPCGLKAMESAKVKANTEEGEVISTISIATSAITTTIIIAVGVLAFSPFIGRITAEGSFFKPAFDYILAALFGSLLAGYFAKHWKIIILPLVVGVIVLLFNPSMVAGTLLFITIIAAVAGVGVLYKLKWL